MTLFLALFAVIILVALRSIRGATVLNVNLDSDPNKESSLELGTLPPPAINTTRVYDKVTNRDMADPFGFTFTWLTAGPGGFASGVTQATMTSPAPEAQWQWDSTKMVSSQGCVQAAGPTQCPVFMPADGSLPNRGPFAFTPGKTVSGTGTVTTVSLTSSLTVTFSPPRKLVEVTSEVRPLTTGEFQYKTRITNRSNQDINFDLASGPLGCGTCTEPRVACGGVCCDAAHCDPIDNVCFVCTPQPGVSEDCNNDGICESLLTDNQNCGSCGAVCAGTCSNGQCFVCPEGETNCGGACVDTSSDRANCGGCGNACSSTETCTAGQCTVFCGNGVIDPGEQCDGASLPTDKCTSFDFCAGTVACDETCHLDFSSCQPCVTCTPVPGSLEDCNGDGVCEDLLSNPLNCGQCGNACKVGEVCNQGVCACGPGFQDCDADGTCDSLLVEPNCGGCGIVCPAPSTCQLGSCVTTPGCGPLGCLTAAVPAVPSAKPGPQALIAVPPSPITACEFPISEPDNNPNDIILTVVRPAVAPGTSGTLHPGESMELCNVDPHPAKEVTSQLTVCGGDIPDGPPNITCSGGGIGSQGPVNVLVPDMTVNIGGAPFLSVLRADARDTSGDGYIQPGETIRLFVSLVNAGPQGLTHVTSLLSAPDVDLDGGAAPDGGDVGPDPVSITQGASAYPDFPAAAITPGTATCANAQPLALVPETNTTPFTIVFPADHPVDTSHPFHLDVTGQTGGVGSSAVITTTLGVNFALSVGGACIPGNTAGDFDSLQGLLSPMGDLVPLGSLLPPTSKKFTRGSTLPLRLRLSCGGVALNASSSSAPVLVNLTRNGSPIDLSTIDPDAGKSSNGGLLFRGDSGKGQWTYDLNTSGLAAGSYLLTIKMPNGQKYVGAFDLK